MAAPDIRRRSAIRHCGKRSRRGWRGAAGSLAQPTTSRSCRAPRAASTVRCNASPGRVTRSSSASRFMPLTRASSAPAAREWSRFPWALNAASIPISTRLPARSRRRPVCCGSTARTTRRARSLPASRSRRLPRCAARTISGCCRTRSTRISPLPARIPALGRSPAWPSALSSCRACRNRMRCPRSASAGSSGRQN